MLNVLLTLQTEFNRLLARLIRLRKICARFAGSESSLEPFVDLERVLERLQARNPRLHKSWVGSIAF